MWLFGKKRISLSDAEAFRGFTDWHSHILPGVDDGVPDMNMSLAILEKYERLGVEQLWLTPHIMEDIPNTTKHLRECYDVLRSTYKGPVKLNLAAENMLDNLFEERLSKGDVLPIGHGGNHLLVETSYYNPPYDLWGMLERVRSAGYFPVLAHPERYLYMTNKDYERLISEHVKLQLNLTSLSGGYGTAVSKKAEWLLKKGYYTLTGTDLHRKRILDGFIEEPIDRALVDRVMELQERNLEL